MIYDFFEGDVGWVDLIDDFFEQGIFWVGFYFVWKIVMFYIIIYFYSCLDYIKIVYFKDMYNVFMVFYEVLIYFYFVGIFEFIEEDMMISNVIMVGYGEYCICVICYFV